MTLNGKQKIKACITGNHETLNLSSCQLTKVPLKKIKKCTLSNIVLSGNYIEQIPVKFFHLFNNLTNLDLSSNSIVEIPAEILLLNKLVRLNLFGNGLSELPSPFSTLYSLTDLNLGANPLNDLPMELEIHLLRLQTFGARSMGNLKNIPDTVLQMKHLLNLDLKGNKINVLPDGFSDLEATLEMLDMSDNNLGDTLSYDCFGLLQNLTVLNLSRNKIGNAIDSFPFLAFEHLVELDLADCLLFHIPETVASCTSLTKLDLSDNKLSEIPYEIGIVGSTLKELNLAGNFIKEVPGSFFYFDRNIRLDLGRNELKNVFLNWLDNGVPYLLDNLEAMLVCDPTKCECIGDFSQVSTNSNITFTVVAKDLRGIKRKNGGDKFLGAIMDNEDGLLDRILVEDQHDGTYLCSFTSPMRPGNFQIIVTHERTHIWESPFSMTVITGK